MLAHDLVVHEATPGPLEHRVIDEQEEPAAGGEHPDRLGQQGIRVGRMLYHEAADDPVERAVPEREAFAHPPDVHRPAGFAGGARELASRRFEPDDDLALGGSSHKAPGEMAFTAPEIEHARSTLEVRLHERKDLELIFQVRAVRERLAPPGGVELPGILGRAHPAFDPRRACRCSYTARPTACGSQVIARRSSRDAA